MAKPEIIFTEDVPEFQSWGPPGLLYASPACQSVSWAGPEGLQKWYASLSPEAMRRLAAGAKDYVLGGSPEVVE